MPKDIHHHFAIMDINLDGFISSYEYHYMHKVVPLRMRYHRYDEHNLMDDTYSLLVFLSKSNLGKKEQVHVYYKI